MSSIGNTRCETPHLISEGKVASTVIESRYIAEWTRERQAE